MISATASASEAVTISGTRSQIIRLPPEILAEISGIYLADTNGPQKTPFFLAKICAFWRSVIWGNAQLWSSVHLDLSIVHFESQLDLLRIWLERSGDCPLFISLFGSNPELSALHPLSKVIDIVVPHCRRWRTLHIHLPISSLEDLASRNCHFPLLTRVLLDPGGEGDEGSHLLSRKYIDAFKLAPQLHDVSVGASFSPLEVVFPWHQLTTFRGDFFYDNQCLEVFRQASNLVHCSFDEFYGSDEFGDIVPPKPFYLSSLASLRMVFFRGRELFLLDHIVAPALRELELLQLTCSYPIDHLLAFISRSSCSLERFATECFSNTASHLLRSLQVMPSLVELKISHLDRIGNQTLLEKLVALPRLTSLVVSYRNSQAEGLQYLTKSIVTPAIRTMMFTGWRHSTFPHSEFLDLLTRSSCPLQSLSFDRIQLTSAQLSELFPLIPGLLQLKLANLGVNTFTDEVIPILLPTEQGFLLPNLQVLKYVDSPPFRDGDLDDMLAARWAAGSLNDVEITLSSDYGIKPSNKTLTRIRELISEGMKIHIATAHKSWF